MDLTQAIWRKQYTALHEQLRPHAIVFEGGDQGISPLADPNLVDLYGKLQSIGYAKGWM